MSARKSLPVSDRMAALRRQYGCGPVELTGSADALYERHLFFDNVIDPAAATARERYEAFARTVRDVLSQRWVRTEQTYDRANPKRVYYMSMEFLPSGTEDIYKIYAESFRDSAHLDALVNEARAVVGAAIGERA